MASKLLEYVDDAMSDERLSDAELRGTVGALCQAVRDLVRVAESRGERLSVPDDDEVSRAADAVIDREIKR